MRKIFSIVAVFLPWVLKSFVYRKIFKYKIDKSARIGLSYINSKYLEMAKHSRIGNFNVFVNLECVKIGEYSSIGRNNWVTGFPTDPDSRHFTHQKNRKPELHIKKHSAITKNHHIDCTNMIEIGSFVTIAGYQTQFLTHSIDIYESRQDSKPISVGDYCFVGTNSVILGGANLPSFCVLGAKSLLNSSNSEMYSLYAGVPAKKVKSISPEAKYFNRQEGFIY